MQSSGSEQLSKALRPRVMSPADLAEKLGVSRQAVSGWVTGKSKPSREMMVKLEDELGIPMRAWTEEPSEETPTGTDG